MKFNIKNGLLFFTFLAVGVFCTSYIYKLFGSNDDGVRWAKDNSGTIVYDWEVKSSDQFIKKMFPYKIDKRVVKISVEQTASKNIDFKKISNFKNLTNLNYSVKASIFSNGNEKVDLAVLKDLTKLKSICINGIISKNFRSLKNLHSLEKISLKGMLDQNEINQLSHYQQLEELGVGLSGNKFDSILKLRRLKAVYFNFPETVESVASFSKLKNVEKMTLQGRFSDIGLVGTNPKLKKLRLRSINLRTVRNPFSSSIEWLDLCGIQVSDIHFLKNCKRLKFLKVNDTSIKDFSILKKLNSLEALGLSKTSFNNISSLMGMKKLKVLDLEKTKVHDVSNLKFLPSLKALDVNILGVGGIENLVQSKDLEELVVRTDSIKNWKSFIYQPRLKYLVLTTTIKFVALRNKIFQELVKKNPDIRFSSNYNWQELKI